MAVNKPLSILYLAFDKFNALDVGGPIDVLCNFALGPVRSTITVAAATEHCTSIEGLTITRNICLCKALANIANFDVLIMPGGDTTTITDGLKAGLFDDIVGVIQAFACAGKSTVFGQGQRVLMSVCTGAMFLGFAGAFAGIQATTHWKTLQDLEEMCELYRESHPETPKAIIVPDPSEPASQNFRYVKIQDQGGDLFVGKAGDPKEVKMQCRVISSGGISCGIDASLYLVSVLFGDENMVDVADVMQYAYRGM